MARKISISVRKKYSIKVSENTVIRRLRANGFVYQKLYKVQELTHSQIYLRFNFSQLLLNFHHNVLSETEFPMNQGLLSNLIIKKDGSKMVI